MRISHEEKRRRVTMKTQRDIEGTKEIRRAVKILIVLVLIGMAILWVGVLAQLIINIG